MTGQRGVFLVLEGLDGAGTTTQLERLAERLRSGGKDVLTTFEPSHGAVGVMVRALITSGTAPDPTELALLFAADRLHHLRTEVLPALEAGVHVLCDRYVLSSLAYQSAEGVDVDWVAGLNSRAVAPDVTVFLDVPVEVCLERIALRSDDPDHFHDPERLRAVDRAYRSVLHQDLLVVDGRPSQQAVTDAIWAQLAARF